MALSPKVDEVTDEEVASDEDTSVSSVLNAAGFVEMQRNEEGDNSGDSISTKRKKSVNWAILLPAVPKLITLLIWGD